MNKLFLKYLLEQKVSQENLAFINSIRSNSNLKPYSLHEVAAPPRRRPPTPGMMVNPGFNNGVPTQYQSNYQTGVAYDQFGNPIGWTASEQFLNMLARHEGFGLTRYPDSKKIPTIGWGINLNSNKEMIIRAWMQTYGSTREQAEQAYQQILSGSLSISIEFAILLKNTALQTAIQDCYKIFGGQARFMQLPPGIQDMLVNLSFNMGFNGLSEFKSAIAAIMAGNWIQAAREFLYRNPAKDSTLSEWATVVHYGAPGTRTPAGRTFGEYGSRAWEMIWIIAHGGVYYDPAIHSDIPPYIGAPIHFSNSRETTQPKPSPINTGTTPRGQGGGGQGGGGQGGGGQGGGGQGGGGQGGGGQGGGVNP